MGRTRWNFFPRNSVNMLCKFANTLVNLKFSRTVISRKMDAWGREWKFDFSTLTFHLLTYLLKNVFSKCFPSPRLKASYIYSRISERDLLKEKKKKKKEEASYYVISQVKETFIDLSISKVFLSTNIHQCVINLSLIIDTHLYIYLQESSAHFQIFYRIWILFIACMNNHYIYKVFNDAIVDLKNLNLA